MAAPRIPVKLRPVGTLKMSLRSSEQVLPVRQGPAMSVSLGQRGLVARVELGRQGSGGTAPRDKALLLDASRPVAFVGFSGRIDRLDYSSWPPVKSTAAVADLQASWPARQTLSYS